MSGVQRESLLGSPMVEGVGRPRQHGVSLVLYAPVVEAPELDGRRGLDLGCDSGLMLWLGSTSPPIYPRAPGLDRRSLATRMQVARAKLPSAAGAAWGGSWCVIGLGAGGGRGAGVGLLRLAVIKVGDLLYEGDSRERGGCMLQKA
jgi:hypothetical protein